MCDRLPGLYDRYQTQLKPSSSNGLPVIYDSVTDVRTYRRTSWKKNGDAFGTGRKWERKRTRIDFWRTLSHCHIHKGQRVLLATFYYGHVQGRKESLLFLGNFFWKCGKH